AADKAVAEIDYPDVVDVNAEGGDEEAAGPAAARREHGAARSAFLDPATEDRCRHAKHEYGDAENPTEIGQLPIVRRRLRDAEEFGHRQVEHAKGIGLADAEMNA